MSPARKEPDLDTYSGRCGARIRELREKHGIKAEELAEICGVAQRSIYNWESGTADPRLEYLPVLAKAFKLKTPRSVLAER